MSLKELVVCKYDGCNKIYEDVRILPCGHRTCGEHIDAMLIRDDTAADAGRIQCYFCKDMHALPESNGGSFPSDAYVPYLLGLRYCGEHEVAKKKFADLSALLDKLARLDNEEYLVEYFKQIENDIDEEREANISRIHKHYAKLIDELHASKQKCVDNMRSNESLSADIDAIYKVIFQYKITLQEKNFDFDLKTLNGDEKKWKQIQIESDTLCEKVRQLDVELKEKLIDDQLIEFVPHEPKTTATASASSGVEKLCGHLEHVHSSSMIESSILTSSKAKKELVALCKFYRRKFELVYRATRDGFAAANFHAKCDNRARTLVVAKTTLGFVFGGYTEVPWDSSNGYKIDPKAFIFSLVNPSNVPLLIPIKAAGTNGIYGSSSYGPAFGGGHDIKISDNSNANSSSYSNLGHGYDFKLYASGSNEAKSFLAGSYNFQTTDIEVFQLN